MAASVASETQRSAAARGLSRSKSRSRARVDVLQHLGPAWKEKLPVHPTEDSDSSLGSNGAQAALPPVQSADVFYGSVHGQFSEKEAPATDLQQLLPRALHRRSSKPSLPEARPAARASAKQTPVPQSSSTVLSHDDSIIRVRAGTALSPGEPLRGFGHSDAGLDPIPLAFEFSEQLMPARSASPPAPIPLSTFVIENYFKLPFRPPIRSPVSPIETPIVPLLVNQPDVGDSVLYMKLEVSTSDGLVID